MAALLVDGPAAVALTQELDRKLTRIVDTVNFAPGSASRLVRAADIKAPDAPYLLGGPWPERGYRLVIDRPDDRLYRLEMYCLDGWTPMAPAITGR